MYGPYQLGKQSKSQYNKNQYLPTMRHLELLHIDLMGAIWTVNINGRKNTLMVVDDFFIYTWVIFLIENQKPLLSLILCVLNYKTKSLSLLEPSSKSEVLMGKSLKIQSSNLL